MKRRSNSNSYQRRIKNPNQRKRSSSYYKRNSSPYQNRNSSSNKKVRIRTKKNHNPNQRARIKTKNHPNQRRRSNSSYYRMNSQPSRSRGFNLNSIVMIIIILAFLMGAGIGVSQVFNVNSDDNSTQIKYQDVTNNVSYYENLSAKSSGDHGSYSDNKKYKDSNLNVYKASDFGRGPSIK